MPRRLPAAVAVAAVVALGLTVAALVPVGTRPVGSSVLILRPGGPVPDADAAGRWMVTAVRSGRVPLYAAVTGAGPVELSDPASADAAADRLADTEPVMLTDDGHGDRVAAAQVRDSLTAAADHSPALDPDWQVGRLAGSSLGLITALATIDAAGPGDLTGGRVVAGTGALSPNGSVGDVGGVGIKAAGATQAGADVFFAPRWSAGDAARTARDTPVVAVTSLDEALDWLCAHGATDQVCATRTAPAR